MIDAVINAKAQELAVAIARAEGFFVAGSLPQRSNNPGDMELGNNGWGLIDAKTVYGKADWNADLDDKTDGCSALRRECAAILTGASAVYNMNDTFVILADKWTGGDSPETWLSAVIDHLGVLATMTLREYVLAP
jgi:hypothetical protein